MPPQLQLRHFRRAVVAVNTDVSGDVVAVGTNTPGTGYSVGDVITFEEDGGAVCLPQGLHQLTTSRNRDAYEIPRARKGSFFMES